MNLYPYTLSEDQLRELEAIARRLRLVSDLAESVAEHERDPIMARWHAYLAPMAGSIEKVVEDADRRQGGTARWKTPCG